MAMSGNDLDIVRAEPAPRSPATCRRVAGRGDSVLGLVGQALSWLVVCWIAVSITIVVGLLLIPGRATPAQVDLIFSASGIVFVLTWAAFVFLVILGRSMRRAEVREGVLVDGAVEA